MSKDNNTNLFATYNRNLVNENISIDSCKECKDLITCDAGLVCGNPNPTTDDCHLLIIEFNK